MNAATDNPLVFAETGELLSGGNFHGEPVALAADLLAIAVAELGGHQRAAHRAAGQPDALRPARVPGPRGRAPLGLHDGPGHRGGAGLREQGPRASRERRLDPDLGRQGGPRLDGRDRRAQGGTGRGQHPPHPRPSSCWPRPRPSSSCARCARRRRSRPSTRSCARSVAAGTAGPLARRPTSRRLADARARGRRGRRGRGSVCGRSRDEPDDHPARVRAPRGTTHLVQVAGSRKPRCAC